MWQNHVSSAYHRPCNLETAKKQDHRERNTTCIRGCYAATEIQYDPGNIAKNSYGKEAIYYAQ